MRKMQRVFDAVFKLRQHNFRKHVDIPINSYCCEYCELRFADFKQMKDHLEICNSNFKTVNNICRYLLMVSAGKEIIAFFFFRNMSTSL